METKENEKNLNSVFTSNLPGILQQLNISLIVSTYQCGKVLLIRRQDNTINTHFRNFNRPMGIAVKPNRISIGCLRTVENYHNVPALISRLEKPEMHDACYVTRSIIETGSIDIHEMAWGSENLIWGVNTRFSCLSTFDGEHSFVPSWRPYFVSALEPSDRCHLNGLAMVNGKPRFVTALGKTDTAGGWRENKRDGGILMDVERNEIIAEGLSMPHSPRWYNNRLWMLESGHGTLVYFEQETGKKNVVCKMPGFTRGLDFAGPLAFVGLSKVRETATFSDFPLLEELEDRICGVYVCHIQTGQVIGFVRFEGDVEEIFAVQVLHNTTFPELMEKTDELLNTTYVIPDDALKDVAKI
ncbi:MAG: TIGR03032 family protein [Prolixibacteraceae bacterium]|nr:TIGR03032 family protein [Prolixibacteraceae bacterium]